MFTFLQSPKQQNTKKNIFNIIAVGNTQTLYVKQTF